MALNKEYNPSIAVKGLNLDYKIDSLIEGEYPYALNAVSRDNLQFLTNDLGNELCVELDGNVIGSIYIEYDIYIIFLDNNKILKLNLSTCEYVVLLELECLNFNINNQIKAAYTTLNDCNQRILYWTDDVNPIRYYNIDTNETITNCNDLSLNVCDAIPTFLNINVNNNGGILNTGTYQFVVSFGKTSDNNSPIYTNWMWITNPIHIFDDPLDTPFAKLDGSPAGVSTNKSIFLQIGNLPVKYNIIRVAVIITINQIISVKQILSTSYSGEYFLYTYTGDSSEDINLDVASIITDKVFYLRAKDLVIKDNRLIIANIKSIKNINYQKYANDIRISYFTQKIRIDVPPLGYKNPKNTYSRKSWMRDEVYEIGIVWEFCDGSYSRVFHIPGREKSTFSQTIDISGNVAYTDVEGKALMDDLILGSDNNAINCDNEKWKNRNTAVRTALYDCSNTTIFINHVYTGTYYYQIYTLPSVDLSQDGFILIEENFEYRLWRYVINGEDIDLSILTYVYNISQTLPDLTDCDNVLNIPCTYSEGHMAYFESCERYPLIKDCNGDYMYPTEEDIDGNIIGQHVRHHRMPDSTIEPHFTVDLPNDAYVEAKEDIGQNRKPYDYTYIYPLGISVNNIKVPDDIDRNFVRGFRIVYVQRTENNKTVVAKGLLHGCFRDEDENNAPYLIPKHGINSYEYYAFPGGGGTHAETANPTGLIGAYTFHSPNTSFLKPNLTSDYLKVEWEFYGRGDVYGDTDEWDNDDFCDGYNFGRRQNYNLNQYTYSRHYFTNELQVNRMLQGLMYAPADTFVNNASTLDLPLDNRNRESSVYLQLKTKDFNNRLTLVNWWDEYQSDDQSPVLANNPIQDCDTSFWKHKWEYNEEWYDNPVRARALSKWSAATWYVAIKRNNCSPYGRIDNLFYIDTGLRRSIPIEGDLFEIKGVYGDSFINYWAYRRTSRIGRRDGDDGGNNDNLNDSDYEGPKFKPKTLKTLIHSIVESDINVDMRYEGDGIRETYYPKLGNGSYGLDSAVPNEIEPLAAYLNRFYYNTCNEAVEDFVDNYWMYNIDYSNVNNKRVYIPITITYKTCECSSELPNVIAYSNKSNLNNFNLNDFLANNYLTVPSNYGPINNLFILNNGLYAHTRDIIWKIFTNEKQLKIDENTVFIGQGDLFSKDPLAVYASNVGYAGNILQFGTLETETGYYFYDIYGGKLHHYSDKLDDLSLKKLMNFFKNNSKFCLPLENKDNYANPEGIGIMMTYDYYNNRLLISKKDYEFKYPEMYKGIYNENTAEPNSIYQHNNRFILTTDDAPDYSFISVKDDNYFCDKSFTLSFSYNLDAWVSFHSFIPDYYLNTRNNFYTIKNQTIYKHNIQCSYHKYYDIGYPYIIDFPVITKPDVMSNKYTALHWNSLGQLCDENCNLIYQYDKTFNKVLLYNSNQSTGVLNLNYSKGGYLRIEPNYPDINIDRNEKYFSLTNIRDYVDTYDKPMFISSCGKCNCDINKTFNNDIINPNKYYKELQRMRDTFMIARFILDNNNSLKLTIDYLITTSTKSIR